jgi:hypothetical protein
MLRVSIKLGGGARKEQPECHFLSSTKGLALIGRLYLTGQTHVRGLLLPVADRTYCRGETTVGTR